MPSIDNSHLLFSHLLEQQFNSTLHEHIVDACVPHNPQDQNWFLQWWRPFHALPAHCSLLRDCSVVRNNTIPFLPPSKLALLQLRKARVITMKSWLSDKWNVVAEYGFSGYSAVRQSLIQFVCDHWMAFTALYMIFPSRSMLTILKLMWRGK